MLVSRRLRFAFLVLLSCAGAGARAVADEFPQPEIGVFGGEPVDPYQIEIRRLLLGGSGARVCQLVSLTPASPENAVYIERARGSRSTTVVYRQARVAVWRDMFTAIQTDQPGDAVWMTFDAQEKALRAMHAQADEWNAPIDDKTTDMLASAWTAVLIRARPVRAKYVVDGTKYHAFHVDERRMTVLAGTIVSPRRGTSAAALVELADLLHAYAQCDPALRPAHVTKLRKLAAAVLQRLRPAG